VGKGNSLHFGDFKFFLRLILFEEEIAVRIFLFVKSSLLLEIYEFFIPLIGEEIW
jgi:hypothetical protein